MTASHRLAADIDTRRLTLRCLSPDAIEAGLLGHLRIVEERLGARVPIDLAEDPAVLRYARAQLDADPEYLPWSVRAMILRDSMEMIGHIRFHTRPDPEYLHAYARGAVELGYVVFAAYRKRGYAQEALTGAMQWALKIHGIRRFVASASPNNLASSSLIAKLGFHKVGQQLDAIDGIEYVYLRDVFGAS